MRVLGIDPGLTRCGVGVVDVDRDRSAALVYVGVVRTPHEMHLEQRLLTVGDGIEEVLDTYHPQVVAIERVFAQHNLRTVMGTAQVSGVALHVAARRRLAVALHTPTEVKAAITGYGAANKKQVQAMVARILNLDAVPQPADAADALALAICHAWRAPLAVAPGTAGEGLTPAQRAWQAAERGTAARAARGMPRTAPIDPATPGR
ncbi:MAG TPA: crossover junction endodeoxyribonuclease RuvC [Humibacter sp.]|nr:crossover junction endodeoxyribonuclease RuvC [Humibacter sp.]